MAEALLKRTVEQRGEAASWRIDSAGTWAEADLPVTQLAHTVMARRGINLNGHRSRPLDAAALREAALVLVMTRHHKEALQAEFPALAGKILLLSELIGEVYDIDDPYGGSLEDYELCVSDIESILDHGFDRLIQLSDRAVPTRKER
jgi:protein-tyrosine-phosphatase